ncbi:MAG: ion transporter, partial [Armatimonadota bacterium]
DLMFKIVDNIIEVTMTATYDKLRRQTYLLLNGKPDTLSAKSIQIGIISLILLNTLAFILSSMERMESEYSSVFLYFEIGSITVFVVEYLLRLWCCIEETKYSHPIKGRLAYIFTPFAIIDLLAILPGIFPLAFGHADFRFLRILRIFRIARLFKLGRYSKSIHLLATVLKSKKEGLFLTVIFVLMMIIISASLLYTVEHTAQPEAFSSIPQSMWWAVMTLTTVGYGDVYPITAMGKFLASIISILGIALFAMPTAILASGFNEQLSNQCNETICPHCGKRI